MAQTIQNELVRELFAYLSKGLNPYYPGKFPWYLGQICLRWRAVFHTMQSAFWRKIDIQWKSSPATKFRCMHMVEVVKMFLTYNQGTLLSFTYGPDYNAEYMDEDWINIHMVLEMQVERSETWSDVYFNASIIELPTLSRARNCLRNLRTLCIYIRSSFSDVIPIDTFMDVFENTLSLIFVEMKDYAGWELNWSGLTTLWMGIGDNTSLLNFSTALERATNLEGLVIYRDPIADSGNNDFSYDDYDDNGDHDNNEDHDSNEDHDDNDLDETKTLDTVTLPRLKNLLLTVSELLYFLKAPALEELTVVATCPDPVISAISTSHILTY
ncbi:hypothetical protein AX15_006150 [Amanita polypyramis BW_CC]|nr:hypothetical protein AX15_006150 [Amanita polypyramis BW_CC]